MGEFVIVGYFKDNNVNLKELNDYILKVFSKLPNEIKKKLKIRESKFLFSDEIRDSEGLYRDSNIDIELFSKNNEHLSDFLLKDNYIPVYYKNYYQFFLRFEEDELTNEIIEKCPEDIQQIFDFIIKNYKETLIELSFTEYSVTSKFYYCKDFDHYINGYLLSVDKLDIRNDQEKQKEFLDFFKKKGFLKKDGSIYEILKN